MLGAVGLAKPQTLPPPPQPAKRMVTLWANQRGEPASVLRDFGLKSEAKYLYRHLWKGESRGFTRVAHSAGGRAKSKFLCGAFKL